MHADAIIRCISKLYTHIHTHARSHYACNRILRIIVFYLLSVLHVRKVDVLDEFPHIVPETVLFCIHHFQSLSMNILPHVRLAENLPAFNILEAHPQLVAFFMQLTF